MDFADARRKMVASQVRTNDVTDALVLSAIGTVPRENFVPASSRGFAYVDEDLSLGNGRFVMEPMVLARLLQLAEIQPTDAALVVGAATGYSAAVLAHMARSVVALEADAALTEKGARCVGELGLKNVNAVKGDLKAGWPARGPYDVILVDGAVSAVPEALKQQLADGGRLVCVVRTGPMGRATLVTRVSGAFGHREEFDAVTPVLPGFEAEPKFVF